MVAAWRGECLPTGVCFRSFAMACFPGAFTGRINKPSLPRSNTFNGPPRSNPSRRHQSSGKIVWRFSVKVMVVVFIVIIHYLKNALCQGFYGISDISFCRVRERHCCRSLTRQSDADKLPVSEFCRSFSGVLASRCQVSPSPPSAGSFAGSCNLVLHNLLMPKHQSWR